jgi:hypothetical protein
MSLVSCPPSECDEPGAGHPFAPDMGGRYFTFPLAAMTRPTSSMWGGAPPGPTLVTSFLSDGLDR